MPKVLTRWATEIMKLKRNWSEYFSSSGFWQNVNIPTCNLRKYHLKPITLNFIYIYRQDMSTLMSPSLTGKASGVMKVERN